MENSMKQRISFFSMRMAIVLAVAFSCKNAVVQPINLGNETTMSSPILKIGESWQGTMAGLIEVDVSYDTLTHTISGTITNVSGKKLCWALSEPHMKLAGQTVGELGPEKLGHILQGKQVNTKIAVKKDPKYTGYTFDGYVLHLEVYDCSGGAPPPY